jgi:hypothetical protein
MVLNRKTPYIALRSTGRYHVYMTVIDHKSFYFSKAASIEFGLKKGKYLHFDNTDGKWSFFQSDDKDGFTLLAGRAGHESVRIENKPLMKMFRSSTKYSGKVRLYLLKSTAEVDGHPVIEIITNKTFDQLMKQL